MGPNCRASEKKVPWGKGPQPKGQRDTQEKGTGKGWGTPVPGRWIKQNIRTLGTHLVQDRFAEEEMGPAQGHATH